MNHKKVELSTTVLRAEKVPAVQKPDSSWFLPAFCGWNHFYIVPGRNLGAVNRNGNLAEREPWTHRETFRVTLRWYQQTLRSLVDRRLQLCFPHFLLFSFDLCWRTRGVFPPRPPARGLAGAAMRRAASWALWEQNESQALVIMLWIINAGYERAGTLAAAPQLSDSGPNWSCTQILNIYSPVQLIVCSGNPPNTFRAEQL